MVFVPCSRAALSNDSLAGAGGRLRTTVRVAAGGDLERALWALRAYDTTALATVSAAGPHVAGVFFAPEIDGDRIRLLAAVLDGSRKAADLTADPRVAFVCSPGNPSRWIQGAGFAYRPEVDDAGRLEIFRRLVAHAPGARQFVDRLPVHPVIIDVRDLKVVEAIGNPPLRLHFE
jgi:hypothetical protein